MPDRRFGGQQVAAAHQYVYIYIVLIAECTKLNERRVSIVNDDDDDDNDDDCTVKSCVMLLRAANNFVAILVP